MSANEAEAAAAEWLARIDTENLTPAELAEFERWRSTDPRHTAAYARLAATWQALDRVQAMRPSAHEPIDNDYLNPNVLRVAHVALNSSSAVAGETVTALSAGASPLPHTRSTTLKWGWASIAASLLVGVATIGIWRASNSAQTYRTGVGGFQRIVLADSSAIDLNTDSEVRVKLTRDMRNVELIRGEASFEVAHDAARPFIVAAGATAVRAVGTKFDVRRS
ncbi:MAG TPA: FecR domain-containing protein, partial [Steroidobacteraceae bacterium]